jgi:hypothetical protein
MHIINAVVRQNDTDLFAAKIERLVDAARWTHKEYPGSLLVFPADYATVYGQAVLNDRLGALNDLLALVAPTISLSFGLLLHETNNVRRYHSLLFEPNSSTRVRPQNRIGSSDNPESGTSQFILTRSCVLLLSCADVCSTAVGQEVRRAIRSSSVSAVVVPSHRVVVGSKAHLSRMRGFSRTGAFSLYCYPTDTVAWYPGVRNVTASEASYVVKGKDSSVSLYAWEL